MKLDSATRFEAREGVLATGAGEARYLTDVQTGDVFELNATALAVFDLAKQGIALAQIIDGMQERFPDVPRDEIDRDARDVLGRLAEMGLLRLRATA